MTNGLTTKMKIRTYNLGALNLKVSPFLHKDGDLIRALNVERDMVGAWKKRPGYSTMLGTPDNDQVNSLWSWTKNDGDTYTYRYSGSVLYYSTAGTGDWTVCGNGTMTEGAYVGNTVLDDTMIIGDGTAVSRHTSSGTSFTNTTSAPLAQHWDQYESRVWAARGTAVSGTNTDMFYSTTGTASDWSTDSSSFRIPGAGRINSILKASDRLVAGKDSGNMFRYDGFNLVDLATNLGPTSPYSIGGIEDTKIYLTRRGYMGYNGGRPQIISNAIERQIYNDKGNGIAGTTFDLAPGIVHNYDYFCSVGTITDNLTDETIADAIHKYDFQLNEWVNWKFADRPTAFGTYKDEDSNIQMMWGDADGQCYQLGGTETNDNGETIEAILEGVITMGEPEQDKRWRRLWAFTNPGSQAKVQVAMADTFTKQNLRWVDLKQTRDGVMFTSFPSGKKSKLLFWKVYEASRESRFHLYGFTIDADIEKK